jgi:hypothetical protein
MRTHFKPMQAHIPVKSALLSVAMPLLLKKLFAQ